VTNSSVVLLAGLDYKDSSIPTKKRFDYSVVGHATHQVNKWLKLLIARPQSQGK